MRWKDLSLKTKFIVGFGSILALLIALAGWSIGGIGTIVGNAEEVIEGNKLKGETVQKTVDHLKWAEKVQTLLTDDNVHQLTVQTDHTKCGFGKWYYGENRRHAEHLVPALSSYLQEIEKPHIDLHKSAIAISKEYKPVDQKLLTFLRLKKEDHLLWMNSVLNSISDPESDTLKVQLDHTRCGLGKWLYSTEVQQRLSEDAAFSSFINPIFAPHEALHKSGRELDKLLHANLHSAAALHYRNDTEKEAHNTLESMDAVIHHLEGGLKGLTKAREIFVTQTLPALNDVQRLLKAMNTVISENIMTDEAMLEAAATTREVIIAVSITAIIIGIVLAYIIAAGIIGPLRRSIDYAKVIATGDLRKTIDTDRNDEVGVLAKALNDMSDKLKEVAGEINSGASNVATGSEELATSAQGLSQGATEQAASVEEISASMEEMTANIQRNAQHATETEKISLDAAKNAAQGGDAVKQTVSAMQHIADKISIVEEIARQTNLLALNAAIEAARAGEHGKGFAVVAAEVRKLAERSGLAASEISELSSTSVEVAIKAGTMLEALVPEIQRTAELVQEIAAGTDEQASGASQVNRAITQLDHVIQQNASAAEEMASTSEELAGQSDQLQQTIAFFKVDNSSLGASDRAPRRVKAYASHTSSPALQTGSSKKRSKALDNSDEDFERF